MSHHKCPQIKYHAYKNMTNYKSNEIKLKITAKWVLPS